jgi:hypothetical protein
VNFSADRAEVPKTKIILRGFVVFAAFLGACGSSNGGTAPATNTGQACKVAADCFSDIDAGSLLGAPLCLTQVPNGYCTHGCSADSDCCAVVGECPEAQAEVCAPFESTGGMDCFLSCEVEVVSKAGFADDTAFCQKYADAAFICRSTGGGSNNRKVCVPSG